MPGKRTRRPNIVERAGIAVADARANQTPAPATAADFNRAGVRAAYVITGEGPLEPRSSPSTEVQGARHYDRKPLN